MQFNTMAEFTIDILKRVAIRSDEMTAPHILTHIRSATYYVQINIVRIIAKFSVHHQLCIAIS